MISIIVPTIPGRERHLERCIAAYDAFTDEFDLIVVVGKPTCGEAWAEGGAKAKGDYLHFSADDLEPHEGWSEPAIKCVESGKLPCPRIYTPAGAIESCGQWGADQGDGTETNIARIPFFSRKQWELGGWVIPMHYYTDNWVWHRGQQLAIPTVVCHGYEFTHHYASEGRLSTIDMDLVAYQAAGGRF